MHESLTKCRKLACRVLAAAMVIGLQTISAGGVASHPDWDGRPTDRAYDRDAPEERACFHAVSGTDSAIHCHNVTAAARALIPERSPDPKETVSDDGIVAALPRAASFRVALAGAPAADLPAFILYSNFRS